MIDVNDAGSRGFSKSVATWQIQEVVVPSHP
jgi:hypothetical protein